MYFDIAGGALYCETCRPAGAKTVPFDRTLLTAARHIVYSEFSKLYSFSVPEESAKRLSDITGEYITLQADHRFKTLDFYNSINSYI